MVLISSRITDYASSGYNFSMERTEKPRVKICCISSVEEAQMAVRYGASAIGLVSAMPSGPGPISEELITEIAATVPPGVATFLLTCKPDVASIIEQQKRTRVNTIQIVDHLEEGTYEDLRSAMPGIAVVQVIHVTGPESIEEAVGVAPHVDAILLDSGNQSLAVKELGGTGRRHNWEISRKIREVISVPIFLAGGLKPENAQKAIEQVGPYGLDVCSGLRTAGRLDEEKLARFFKVINTRTE
jgi:phosphoribosylanthranilate isomerase